MAISKPKAGKPSKVVKPQRASRKTTESHRQFRYQSFTERISKLKIDPIRRNRNIRDDEELGEDTATYFGRSLEEWRDLNMCQTFASFAKDVAPLCDSLPMVLHNEDRIMDILVDYIARGDALAMEPLLSLLSHFAHDLDTRFETHFQRAVSTVAAMAAKHEDAAVVEWSFTCLAWLFKYLSRLLTPDLRPLFDLMSAYLGKKTQKAFIIRFAAESMSFLIRKAAAVHERDPEPLDRIVTHILVDVEATTSDTAAADLYRQGIMNLLSETIKGIQSGIHSCGLAVLQSMLKSAFAAPSGERSDVFLGVLKSIIHFTNSHTFRPVLEFVLSGLLLDETKLNDAILLLDSRLLFTIASVRKGTRVRDNWSIVVKAVSRLMEAAESQSGLSEETMLNIVSVVAVTLQSASVDAVLPALRLLEKLRQPTWSRFFLRFCDAFARLGRERFQQFLLPQLQKFIAEDQWTQKPSELLETVPRISLLGEDKKLACPESLQNEMLSRVMKLVDNNAAGSDDVVALADVALTALPCFKIGEKQTATLADSLAKFVDATIMTGQDSESSLLRFAVGTAQRQRLTVGAVPSQPEKIWKSLCANSPRFLNMPTFWANMATLAKMLSGHQIECEELSTLEPALITALSVPSHDARQHALDVMQTLYKSRKREIPEVLAIAILIESTPASLDTSRGISMNVRRLATAYAETTSDDLMLKAMPTYCFGLLHLRLAQAWSDAVEALAAMTKSQTGEDTIVALAQTWLENAAGDPEGLQVQSTVLDVNSEGFYVVSAFECSNFDKIAAICKQSLEEPNGGLPSPEQHWRTENELVPRFTATTRSQALRALDKIPQVAEKRSRLLVPVLLQWAGEDTDIDGEAEETAHSRWSRKDQKSMLNIFAQFNNPRVLYRSTEVHSALLHLCTNGDAEIQGSALKAILAWKDPAVNRYAEHLANFLDESRFREEISVFLQGDEEEGLRQQDYENVMPVLLRLLYGRVVGGNKEGQHARRRAVFVALSRFNEKVLGLFINIALGTAAEIRVADGDKLQIESAGNFKMPLRQQLGMLNMVNDMLETLGAALEPFTPSLLDASLLCAVAASNQIEGHSDAELKDASLLRSIRQTGLQCMVKAFASMQDLDCASHCKLTVKDIIAPRLANFAQENNQGISAMLRLFSAWSSSSAYAPHLVKHDESLLYRVADLLRDPSTKDEVKTFILRDIVDRLLANAVEDALPNQYASAFVASIGTLLGQSPTKDVLDVCVQTITQLAERISDPAQAGSIIGVCTILLTQPSIIVSPRTKANILRTILPLLDLPRVKASPELYTAICNLFSRLRDLESRDTLSTVLAKCSTTGGGLEKSAAICQNLNALDAGRLNVPNHQRREEGFAKVYSTAAIMSQDQWLPILHNCMFFIRDEEDTVNRSSAARALELFITASGNMQLLKSDLVPAIQRGMKERSELVRAEFLRLLGYVVQQNPDWTDVKDMRDLTVDGDDEASFFLNALHIQQHRRLRALKRLAEDGHVSSRNISRVFLPLLEHFIFDQAEGDAGRTLADQTVITIGQLSKRLKWSEFRSTLMRYYSYLKTKIDLQKTVLRLVGALIEGLKQPMDSSLAVTSEQPDVPAKETAPQRSRASVIISDFLPPLTQYLHRKDESTVDRRVAVAVSIVKLLRLLPEDEFVARLAPTLTDISHILKSRDLEAREQTRRTLGTILSMVGPRYLSFMLKELRSALQRGYQLHVLSYTVHYLLVRTADTFQPGDLDACLPELTAVVMDDVFGVTGQEKDAEEYKSGMKEIKSSKSFDTLEILARVTSITKLGPLIMPIRALLQEKVDAKMVRKIDELLVRVRKGVDQNPAAETRDMLVFCHEIVRQVYAQQSAPTANGTGPDYRIKKYLSQVRGGRHAGGIKGATTSYIFKLSAFALNLVRKVVRRHEDLQTPANMAGFLPIIGDAMVEGQEEVQIAAMKLLSTIIRVPLADLESNAPVYFKEAVGMIKSSPNTTTDSAKAALELITAILREKRSVDVKERDIGFLLKTLKPDLDEPDRQGVLFRFLRAVLGRKIVITEVYEVMDEVARMMIVNSDESVRQSARSAYVQFVLEFPQGKDRWTKQTGFLVRNLEYEHVAGRRSVMEVLHQLLGKLGDEVVAQILTTTFIGLVSRLVSDTDSACRDMAALLIGRIFERADDECLGSLRELLRKWLGNEKKAAIRRAAVQCWAIFVRTGKVSRKEVDMLLQELVAIVGAVRDMEVVNERQILKNALLLFTAVCEIAPERAFTSDAEEIWSSIQERSAVPVLEVQEIATKLVGMLFNNAASTSSKNEGGIGALPLRASGGLELDADDLKQACAASLRVLKTTSHETPELVAQTVRNLAFLGRVFATNGMQWRAADADEDAKEDEEDDDAEVEAAEDNTKKDNSALGYLLSRLSALIRHETLAPYTRTAALQAQAALLTHLFAPLPRLQAIIRPLYTLTDPSIPQPPDDAHKELTDRARELLELIQKKLGSETYVAALGQARKAVQGRRDERRRKRRVEAVTEPERWAKDKRRKYDAKKTKAKAKGDEARGKRRGW